MLRDALLKMMEGQIRNSRTVLIPLAACDYQVELLDTGAERESSRGEDRDVEVLVFADKGPPL